MTDSEVKNTRIRLGLVFLIFVLAFGAVMYRAFRLQVLDREGLVRIADAECHRTITIPAVRGNIYDRQGDKLAVSVVADSVFAQPSQIVDRKKAAAKLAKALRLDRRNLARTLQGKKSFVWLKRQVEPREAARVKALGLKGVGFVKESKRFYPNKDLAAHVLGFVGVDAEGLEGLERQYERYLNGGDQTWRMRRDALGRTYQDWQQESPQIRRGADIILTLDRRIQYATEKALARAVKEYGAKGGAALVVRPQTGEILAMAAVPGFNPNVFGRYRASTRRNRVLTDTFDPGSTFKVFVAAAALEEGVVRPEDKVFCEKGRMKVGKYTIHDHKPYEWLTVNQVIQHSSNIGTAKIGEMLGPSHLFRYLERFNFGRRTGIDFPAESAGLLRPYKKWRKVDQANVAFGQGVTVTALQMTMAMAALANDGLMMRPYLVSEVRDSEGRTIVKRRPEIVRQVVSERTAREVRYMLRLVVETGGTGTRADTPGYPAAGKTGTAQKLDRVNKRYSQTKFYSSFLGYVPHHHPELALFIGIDEPKTEIYGGVVAAPVFREIAAEMLPLMNVAPLPVPEALTARADTKPTSPGISPQTKSKVRPAKPEAVQRLEPGRMPNLSGLSMRRVMDLMARYEVDLQFSGSGQAVWQRPTPGVAIKPGQVCRVRFEQW